jgi:soluble lytic murein transglycosylase-like protein
LSQLHAALAGSAALLVLAWGVTGLAPAPGPSALERGAAHGFLRLRPGLLAGPLAPASSSAEAWRDARLREIERAHARRIAGYARRYRISIALSREIYEAARAAELNPALAFGLVQTESSFNPRAVGPKGSIGLTQLQPATARELAPEVTRRQLFTPRVNLALGFRYLQRLMHRFDEDVSLALVAYNRGPGSVETLLSHGRTPGRAYARKVLRHVGPGSAAAL